MMLRWSRNDKSDTGTDTGANAGSDTGKKRKERKTRKTRKTAGNRMDRMNGPEGKTPRGGTAGADRAGEEDSRAGAHAAGQGAQTHPTPPEPPLVPTPWHAINPDTSEDVLWQIARQVPTLRRWLVANPAASPALLEYVAQQGGPGVAEAFDVLFAGLEGRA